MSANSSELGNESGGGSKGVQGVHVDPATPGAHEAMQAMNAALLHNQVSQQEQRAIEEKRKQEEDAQKAKALEESKKKGELQVNPGDGGEEEPVDPELNDLISKLEENKEKVELIKNFPQKAVEWARKHPLGWKKLCEALAKNNHVTTLVIFTESFPLKSWLHLCDVIRDNKGIKELSCLQGLGDAGNEYIEPLFKALQENYSITNFNLPACGKGRNDFLLEMIANYLRKTTTLRRLGLMNYKLPGDLRTFRLFCDALSSNKSLTHLRWRANLPGNQEAAQALFIALGNHPTLTNIDLAGAGIGRLDEATLRVFCNDFLNKTKTVTTLSLSGNNLDCDGKGDLGSKGHLQLLWNALAVNRTIQFLDISHTLKLASSRPLQQENFRALCQAIAKNNTLKGLNLASNYLGGLKGISLPLKIMELGMSEGQAMVVGTKERWISLCNALSENQSISELNLELNDLEALTSAQSSGEECWEHFRHMLTKKPLTSLSLDQNFLEHIPNESLSLLHEGIDNCPTLTSLKLDMWPRRTERGEDQDSRELMLYKTFTSPQFVALYLPLCNNQVFENKELEAKFLGELAQNTRLTFLDFPVDSPCVFPGRNSPAIVQQYRAIPIRNITVQHFESARGIMNYGAPSGTLGNQMVISTNKVGDGFELGENKDTKDKLDKPVKLEKQAKAMFIPSGGRKALTGPLCDKILSFLYVSIGTEVNHKKLRQTMIQHVSNHVSKEQQSNPSTFPGTAQSCTT